MQRKRKTADCDPDRGKQNRRRQPHPSRKRLTDRDDYKQTGNDGENNGSVEHGYTNTVSGIGLNLDLSAEVDHPVQGIRKNSVAASALRCIASNSRRRIEPRRDGPSDLEKLQRRLWGA